MSTELKVNVLYVNQGMVYTKNGMSTQVEWYIPHNDSHS